MIENAEEAVYEEKAPEAVPMVLLMDRFGYVKSIDVPTYERNKESADAENRAVIPCMSDERICLFTDTGQLHLVKMSDVPYGKFRDKGIPIDNICNYSSSTENIVGLSSVSALRGKKMLFVTKTSMVKRVDGSEFDVAKRTTAATKLLDGDVVLCAGLAEDDDTFVMQSEKNYFLRVMVGDIPEKKKGAVGVRGMRLNKGDALTGAWILKQDANPVVEVRDREIALNRLHIGNRDTKGVKR